MSSTGRSSSPTDTKESAYRRELLGEMREGYGGLPEETLHELCLLLDTEIDVGPCWIQLAERLVDAECRLIEAARRATRSGESPTKTILKVYFSHQKRHGHSDADAIAHLVEVLRGLPFERAAEIIENARNWPDVVDRLLRRISEQLGPEWERLATSLGFEAAEILHFKANHPGHVESQTLTMLDTWKRKQPSSVDQTAELHRALTEVGRVDFAGKPDIDDRLLRRISGQLDKEWKRLATILSFTAAEISHFKANHPGHVESQILSMLITWKRKQPSSVDQTTELHRALTEVGRVDLAEELMGVDDQLLRRISRELGPKWERLALRLGFTTAEISTFATNYPDHIKSVIYYMLTTWRQTQPSSIDQTTELHRALTEVGRVHLAKELKDIDDLLLRWISERLGPEWERLATSLGFTAAKISHFKANHPDDEESQIFNMLITWRQKQPFSVDQTTELQRALTEVDRVDLAEGIDDQRLRKISRQLGPEWKQFVRRLGFTETDISTIEMNHPGHVENASLYMLITWRRKQPSSVHWITELHRTLTEVDRMDLADELDADSEATSSSRLEYCQQQVIQHYKTTTSTIFALPLDPTRVVGIDKFLPLGLIKSLHQRGLGQREMRASGIYAVLVDEPTKSLKTWEDLLKSEVVGSVKVLLFGRAGAGKSTLLVKIANSCIAPGPGSPLAKFKLVFLLKLRQMSTSCVVDAIFEQILPLDTDLTKRQLVEIIHDNEAETAFLLDGLDEIPSAVLESDVGTYRVIDILRNRTLVKCCVLITTRPHMKDYVLRGYPNYAQVEIDGFTPENRDKYIESYFPKDPSEGKSLLSQLAVRKSLGNLALTPIFTKMLCILWKSQGSLPFKMTDLYSQFSRVLVSRRFGTRQDVLQLMKFVLDRLGHTAMDGLLGAQGERLIFSAEEIDQDVLKQGCDVGFLQEETFTSGLKVKRLVTFLHKSFQEFGAARHLSMLAVRDESQFHQQLEKISSTNVDKVENLLRFCCGTSVKAAGLILEHVNKMRGDNERLQRLARLLLFESGSVELVVKLDRPTKVKCESHEDLLALRYYLQHVQHSLKGTQINVYCRSIVDLRLLRDILNFATTYSVEIIRVYYSVSPQGKEELQLLEEILRSVGAWYGDRLRLLMYIEPASWFDAEYAARSLARMSHQIHHLGPFLRGRLPSDVFAITEFLTRCSLWYFGVKYIDMHGHVTRLAPIVTSLWQLALPRCRLVDDDVEGLISILPAGHGLEVLDVSGNSFSWGAVEALTRHLRSFPRLRALEIDNIGLDPNIVKEVVGRNLPDMKETGSGEFEKCT